MAWTLRVLATTSRKFSLKAYSDFDWVNGPDDKSSTYGPCIYLGLNLLS